MATQIDNKLVDMRSVTISGRGCDAYYVSAFFTDGTKLNGEPLDMLNEVSSAQETRADRLFGCIA